MNYHARGQTGNTIINCFEEFEHVQSELQFMILDDSAWYTTVGGQTRGWVSTIINYLPLSCAVWSGLKIYKVLYIFFYGPAGLVAKMELHMREQTRQVDQERWRLSQEESRLKALQAALEDERRITMEQLSAQRAEVMCGKIG